MAKALCSMIRQLADGPCSITGETPNKEKDTFISEATTATYDPTFHYKIAQTNANGISAYFTNDAWGRATFEGIFVACLA